MTGVFITFTTITTPGRVWEEVRNTRANHLVSGNKGQFWL